MDEFLEKFKPETLKSTIVRAGLFLIGWELLKARLIDNLDTFINYKHHPLLCERKKVWNNKRFEESLAWYVNEQVLSPQQAQHIRKLRDRRNSIAHELVNFLFPGEDLVLAELSEIHELLRILALFWVRIDIECNGEFDGQEIQDEDIKPGDVMLMDLVVKLVNTK